MKCPVCKNLLIIEQDYSSDSSPVDMFNNTCINKKCWAVCGATSYMPFVQTMFHHENKETICLFYSFPFIKNNMTYVLNGNAYTHTVFYSITSLKQLNNILKIKYIDIPVDDTMHIEIEKVFNKLLNLRAFL